MFSRQRRVSLKALLALGLTSNIADLFAQSGRTDWPSRPIRLIVPYAPGGATDSVARVIGEALSKRVGQPVIVDNRTGAGGIIGTDAVAKAAPDGHTLLMALSTSMLINQFLYTRLPYNPQRDLTLITQVVSAPVALVVHPSVPAANMKELLAYVKANRGKLSYGSWGIGSAGHLAGAWMSKTTGANMAHVAYKGEAPMLQDVVGGILPMGFASVLSAKPFLDADRLKVIGVTGRQRVDIVPGTPSIYEQGVTDDAYALTGWLALAGPAGLPGAIVSDLHAHLREIAKDPKVLERISNSGFSLLMNTPQEFQSNYQRDMPLWKALVEASDAKLDAY